MKISYAVVAAVTSCMVTGAATPREFSSKQERGLLSGAVGSVAGAVSSVASVAQPLVSAVKSVPSVAQSVQSVVQSSAIQPIGSAVQSVPSAIQSAASIAKSGINVAVSATSAVKPITSAVASAPSAIASLASASTPNAPPSLAWKAGLSGFPTIQDLEVFQENFLPYISWYSNYDPVAPNFVLPSHKVVGAPMLWGKGDQCLTGPDGPVDAERLANFTAFVALPSIPLTPAEDPDIFFGFYEPDCNCSSSSHIPAVDEGVVAWDTYIKPLASRGIPLGSPPMCTQLDEFWLTDFAAAGVTWDITSVHVNKPTVAEGIEVVEYYYNKFGKPVWVSELTCVEDKDWSSCGDQNTVNAYIDGMVAYLEQTPHVIAYGANTGEGVPGVWNLFDSSVWPPTLTATGEHYLSVLEKLRSG